MPAVRSIPIIPRMYISWQTLVVTQILHQCKSKLQEVSVMDVRLRQSLRVFYIRESSIKLKAVFGWWFICSIKLKMFNDC